MMPVVDILRYVAFSDRPDGGNPAGVVLDASGLSDERMLEIAAEVGYSETAFLDGDDIRYFSPLAEVPFCGHATIATAVALAERDGPGERVLNTVGGPVPVITRRDDQGRLTATLTSVTPHVDEVDAADVDEVLAALRWRRDDLDPALPPAIGYVGGYYLVAARRARASGSPTSPTTSTASARSWPRATGPRCSSSGARTACASTRATRSRPAAWSRTRPPAPRRPRSATYLRELGYVEPPATVTILQGEDMGRPGRLLVDLHADRPEIDVTGTAVALG